MKGLLRKREGFTSEWKLIGLKDLQLEVLNHILREKTVLLENMDYKRKEKKEETHSKAREQ